MQLEKVEHTFLRRYLQYVEDTESPRIFHVWAALAGVSACLGRRCYIPFGPGEIFANQYILLVGPPGVKKSSAIKVVTKLLKRGTAIRFAPDDMGGQRQGLIKVMEGDKKLDEEEEFLNGTLDAGVAAFSLEKINSIQLKVDARDAHCMLSAASEFNTFIGQNSVDLINFLVKVWDGEDYEYETKNGQMVLRNPLLSIIGGTTPTNIVKGLPPEAIGQGFMSRVILVHSNKPYKKIPWPKDLDPELEKELKAVYNELYYKFDGEIIPTAGAKALVSQLYDYNVDMQDTRFVYYQQRRQAHLLKCAMALAASELRNQIEESDIKLAHNILVYTEKFMPDALGEFGLSPVTVAKQKMLEFIQNCRGPVSTTILWAVMNKDMRQVDFLNSLRELHNANKIVEVTLQSGDAGYVYRDKNEELMQELEGFL